MIGGSARLATVKDRLVPDPLDAWLLLPTRVLPTALALLTVERGQHLLCAWNPSWATLVRAAAGPSQASALLAPPRPGPPPPADLSGQSNP